MRAFARVAAPRSMREVTHLNFGRAFLLMLPRSLMFVPGDSGRKIERALSTAADCLIIDLEDAVAPSSKEKARDMAENMLRRARTRRIAVRINGQDTRWYRPDLLAIAAAAPDFVMLPKCTAISDLVRLDHELALLETSAGLPVGEIAVLPLVTETATSLSGLDYRGAPPRVAALCFAAEDLAADLGIAARDTQGQLAGPLAQARTATVLAARAAGLPAFDTPFPDPRRTDQLLIEASRAVSEGFAGKLCIHPDQLAPVNDAFSPAPDRVRWAIAVIAAFREDPTTGVATVDGRMVDKAHFRLAEQIEARAAADAKGWDHR